MARIRSIKPEFWTSEQVMELSRDARLLFIGLWTFCDDGGNHPASAKTLKAEVFPGDDDATVSRVMQWIDEMIEAQLVTEYEVEGKEFWHVTGWHHQRIDQPTLRHPKVGDAGDTGDTGDAGGDARHPRHQKRLGGKQRQLLLKKLRERDGDACHQCGDASSLTIIRVTSESTENPQEIAGFRLICPSCKRKLLTGDAQVTHGDSMVTRGCLDGDSPREGRGGEGSREELTPPSSPPARAREADGDGDAEGDAPRAVGEPFAMTVDWQPSAHLRELARQGGLVLNDSETIAAARAEFVAYWLTQRKRRTQHEWDHALIKSLKADRLRPPVDKGGAQPRQRAAKFDPVAFVNRGSGGGGPVVIDVESRRVGEVVEVGASRSEVQ